MNKQLEQFWQRINKATETAAREFQPRLADRLTAILEEEISSAFKGIRLTTLPPGKSGDCPIAVISPLNGSWRPVGLLSDLLQGAALHYEDTDSAANLSGLLRRWADAIDKGKYRPHGFRSGIDLKSLKPL